MYSATAVGQGEQIRWRTVVRLATGLMPIVYIVRVIHQTVVCRCSTDSPAVPLMAGGTIAAAAVISIWLMRRNYAASAGRTISAGCTH